MIPARLKVLFAIFAVCLSAAAANGAGLPGFVVVPFTVTDNRYVLHCTLNGHPLNLIIDSGAAFTVLDRDAFNRAIPPAQQVVPKGVPPKVTGNGVTLPVFLATNLQIGSVKLGDGPVVVADMSRQNLGARAFAYERAQRGMESVVIDGLVGLDILRVYNAVVDTSRHVMYLNPDRSKRGGMLSDKMLGYGYKRVRLHAARGGILEATCSMNGKAANMVVDTGAFLSIVDYQWARNAGVSMRPTRMQMGLGIGGHGETTVFVAAPAEFKVGDFVFSNLSIAAQGLEHSLGSGLFGPELMERGHAIIDFGNLSMFLK